MEQLVPEIIVFFHGSSKCMLELFNLILKLAALFFGPIQPMGNASMSLAKLQEEVSLIKSN